MLRGEGRGGQLKNYPVLNLFILLLLKLSNRIGKQSSKGSINANAPTSLPLLIARASINLLFHLGIQLTSI